jgi:hypothetical protein
VRCCDAEATSPVVAEAAPSVRSGGGSGAPMRGRTVAGVGQRPARGRAAPDRRCGSDVNIGGGSFRAKEEPLLLPYFIAWYAGSLYRTASPDAFPAALRYAKFTVAHCRTV